MSCMKAGFVQSHYKEGRPLHQIFLYMCCVGSQGMCFAREIAKGPAYGIKFVLRAKTSALLRRRIYAFLYVCVKLASPVRAWLRAVAKEITKCAA